MKGDDRLTILAAVLGAACGAFACGVWAVFVWREPWLLVTTCGLLTGALGGFNRTTVVEALFIAVIVGFILWFLSRFAGRWDETGVRVLFALFTGLAIGQLAGSFTSR